MSFLLDTNVISELRKGVRCNPGVRAWLEAQMDGDLYLSVVALAEIRGGIEQLRGRDAYRAIQLEIWLQELVRHFGARVLSVSAEIADRWGRLNLPEPLPDLDRFIAATAIEHGLTIVTRNVRDFERAGVGVVNPWEGYFPDH